MIKGKGYCFFLVFLIVVLFPTTATANWNKPDPKLVVVNLTRVDFTDFTSGDYPYLQRLLTQGQIGLVSVRVAGKLTPEKAYQVLSAAPSGLTGEKGSTPEMGLLGSTLRQAGKQTAYLGNADLPWKKNRSARILVTDACGEVDYEIADNRVLKVDPQFPFGFCSDYQQIYEFVLTLLPVADIILVETGDFERLEGYRGIMAEKRWGYWRAQTLARIDAFLGHISATAPPNTTILVLGATPSSAGDGNPLPLLPLLIDQERGAPGLLTTPSTRTPGLITGGDLAALIGGLVNKNIEKTNYPSTAAGSWSRLQENMIRWATNLSQRKVILRLYLYALIILLFGSMCLPFTPWRRLTTYTRSVLPALAFLPLAMLLLAPLRINDWPLLAVLMVLGTGGLWTFACLLFPTRLLAYRGLLVGTALVILVDLLFGSKLMLASLLGPSPLLGHRFYGLGNEYLGVFLGAFLLGGGDFLIRSPGRKWSGVLLGVGTLLVFSPFGGANFGGGVALIYAAWLICRRIKPPKLAKQNLILFFFCLLVGLGFQTLSVASGGKTHLHNALRLLRLGAWDQILAIAIRKIRMNLGLINYSPWGTTLLLIFILLIIGLQVAERLADQAKFKMEWFGLGTIIAVNTGLVALSVNDSGIVVIAPLVLYPLILFAELWLAKEREDIFARLKQVGRRCVGIGKN